MLSIRSREFILKEPPGAFCHASSLALLPRGSLYCCFFAGSKEGADDCAVYGVALRGGHWQEPRLIAGGGCPHWNPVLWPNGKELVLFYKKGRRIAAWQTFVRRSYDEGRTWSEEEELVPGDRGGRGPVRNKVLTLKDGALLAGASTEKGEWLSFADRSEDGGRTWRLSPPIGIENLTYEENFSEVFASGIAVSPQSFRGRGVIQPSLWQDELGVHMLLRSSEGKVYRADSFDDGRNFSSPYPLAVPNNNSGLDAVYTGKRLYLACNPVAENWGSRSPLSLLSSENGLDFKKELDLETGPGEYSYPCLLCSEREGLHLHLAAAEHRSRPPCLKLNQRSKNF